MNVRHQILMGLARNKAASSDVLLRLLHPEAKVAWSWLCNRAGLPAAVVDALVTHPDWRVRGEFAQSADATGSDRARLVDDPERRVRLELAYGPQPYRRLAEPLPDETYARLLSAPDRVVRETAAQSSSIPDRVLAEYAGHEDPWVRKGVCRTWDALDPAVREALLADPDAAVRLAANRQACRTDALLTDDVLAAVEGSERREALAGARLPRATAERLMDDLDDPYDRQALASNPSLPSDLVARLAVDPEHDVRRQVSARPELTEEQRAAIDYEVKRTDALRPLPWVLELDAEALRPVAASAHRWLRRSAAVHPALPADLVERLAEDEDFVVRLMICEYQPDAPAEALLRMVLEWDGYSSYDMLRMPQFPRKGLARYADDPSPSLRRLAVFDPDAPPELIERLSRDESAWVQRYAAPDHRLPRPRIEELLREPWLAQEAAANPALTEADMHGLLDELGVPA
ncbi:hypothetical protein [Streptomyces ipomoeae]|uniref:Leucine rich repeat variant n=1 Tax=Streptomyces ipomoeae 91-03 TaxID=698759 RepID=L1KW21_9ACTN|nr:hypothetical protein [Streptomyces ipomoeae]EKX64670.1 leucine rich repeat variant [Streptomyces ipomoeae 91-03]TQE26543.1 hypothetical protein Sipo7851_33315 [Streptomyces ipomoeae]